MKIVRRFDSTEVPSSACEVTPEGFLRAPARISRVGVYAYAEADGRIVRELRLPEDVFEPDSIASFRMLPITDGHPEAGAVTAENARELQRGHLGENVGIEEDRFLSVNVLITDAALVGKVTSGDAVELSAGYKCGIVEGAGTHEEFGEYDRRQVQIRGNHVAVVATGRAGPEVRLRLDEGDARLVMRRADNHGDATIAPTDTVQEESTMKITIRGASVEVPDTLAALFDAERKDAADALAARDATIATLTGEREGAAKKVAEAQARADSLDARVQRLDGWLPMCCGRMCYPASLCCQTCTCKVECAGIYGCTVPGDPAVVTDGAKMKMDVKDPIRLDGLKAFESKILDGARVRADLEQFATKVGVEVKKDAADVQIRRDVAGKLSGFDLAGKTDAYVDALFDVERKRVDSASTGAQIMPVIEKIEPKADEKDETGAANRKAAMERRDSQAWKTPPPGAVVKS